MHHSRNFDASLHVTAGLVHVTAGLVHVTAGLVLILLVIDCHGMNDVTA